MAACKDKRLHYYEQLINRSDRIVISSRENPDTLVFSSALTLNNIKEILKRNIQPEPSRKFMVDKLIKLYEAEKKIGVLMVSYGEKSYVNFRSDSLNFTFPLTYGIGMFLNELTSGSSY